MPQLQPVKLRTYNRPEFIPEKVWDWMPAFPFEFKGAMAIGLLPRAILKSWSQAGTTPEFPEPPPMVTPPGEGGGSDIRVGALQVEPSRIRLGEQALVKFWAANYGSVSGYRDILGQTVRLGPRESQWFSYSFKPSQVKTYELRANGLTAFLEVFSATGNGGTGGNGGGGGNGGTEPEPETPPPEPTPTPAPPTPPAPSPYSTIDLGPLEILEIEGQPIVQDGGFYYTPNPISMSALRGIDVKWKNKSLQHYDSSTNVRLMMWFYLHYQPQTNQPANAPKFQDPAASIPAPGAQATARIRTLWVGGVYAPGQYAGKIDVYSNYQVSGNDTLTYIGSFSLLRLAMVSGSGQLGS